MNNNRYKKKKKVKKKQTGKVKKFFTLFMIVICTAVFTVGVYTLYLGTDVYQDYLSASPDAQRVSQTIEQQTTEEETVINMLEETMSSVVGISKIKNNGNSIFLKDSSTILGLGTGVIVSENGYILTNEHVSGSKYGNCYVTLEDGKSYNASVVWSDSDIDLSLIKVNARGLPYIKLGDSDVVRVGQNVYAIGNPIGFEFQRTVTSRNSKCYRQDNKNRGECKFCIYGRFDSNRCYN